MRVLRLKKDDEIIFFDQKVHSTARIESATKRAVFFTLDRLKVNKIYSPSITFLLPLLKKDAFEHAVFNLISCGINHIQPIITQQCHRTEIKAHEYERLERIIIDAAQISKNFSFNFLQKPISLEDAVREPAQLRLFFDPEGESILKLHDAKVQKIVAAIGPEGDMAAQEKEILADNGFTSCALTPTILKADQAALVASGLLRSLF